MEYAQTKTLYKRYQALKKEIASIAQEEGITPEDNEDDLSSFMGAASQDKLASSNDKLASSNDKLASSSTAIAERPSHERILKHSISDLSPSMENLTLGPTTPLSPDVADFPPSERIDLSRYFLSTLQ